MKILIYEFLTMHFLVDNINITDMDSFDVKVKLKIRSIHGSADIKLKSVEKNPPFYAKLLASGMD